MTELSQKCHSYTVAFCLTKAPLPSAESPIELGHQVPVVEAVAGDGEGHAERQAGAAAELHDDADGGIEHVEAAAVIGDGDAAVLDVAGVAERAVVVKLRLDGEAGDR